MMNEDQFKDWVCELGLIPAAKELVARIRTSNPVRRVQSAAGNVSGTFPSRKMGHTIQFESHTLELAYIHLLENDPDVLEYYDQPEQVQLSYKLPNNRKVSFFSTPDFFVIRNKDAGWVEVKPLERLKEWNLNAPSRAQLDHKNRWICPPGMEYASQFGLYYKLITEADLHPVLVRNLDFLQDYLRAPLADPKLLSKTLCLLQAQPGISITDIKTSLNCPVDIIFGFIAHHKIYVDLKQSFLSKPGSVELFASFQQSQNHSNHVPLPSTKGFRLEVGASCLWHGTFHKIINFQSGIVSLESNTGSIKELKEPEFYRLFRNGSIDGVPCVEQKETPLQKTSEALSRLSPQQMERILERQKFLSGENPKKWSERTQRRLLKGIQEAEIVYGSGIIALAGNHHRRGNRTSKIPTIIKETMDKFIHEQYQTMKGKNKSTVYAELRKFCQEKNIAPPSYKTFSKAIKSKSGHKQDESRAGRRGAYASKEFVYYITHETPRHGDWPFHVGHIDHTQLDVELIDHDTGTNLGRPWLSLFIDAFSRRVLAFVVTFDPPSYRSCMLLIRNCVQNFNRLPKIIVVDGGKEFQSTYFDGLLAGFEITKKVRPPAQPRFGSILERLFGTTNTQFIHNLQGNTKLTKRPRTVTKQSSPKNLAVWNLKDLHENLKKYFFDAYDSSIHSSLLCSPKNAFERGLQTTGEKNHLLIPYDENFEILTLPAPKRGSCQIHANTGIRVGYIDYWNNLFRSPTFIGKKVPVRYDPFNLSIAYAYLNNKWIKCTKWSGAVPDNTTEKQVHLAALAFRRKSQLLSTNKTLTQVKLAQLIQDSDEQEILLQKSRDRALAGILSRTSDDEVIPAQTKTVTPRKRVPKSPSLPKRSFSFKALNPLEEL